MGLSSIENNLHLCDFYVKYIVAAGSGSDSKGDSSKNVSNAGGKAYYKNNGKDKDKNNPA